jgi:hypothetical protein
VNSAHDQPGGGATQSFVGGVITWTGGGGAAEHEVSGDTVKFDSGQVNTVGLALNGNVQLAVNRNGTFTINGHVHNSGIDPISYVMVIMLVTAPGDAFQIRHDGHVDANVKPIPIGDPNDPISATGNLAGVTDHWNDIVASGRLLVTLTGQGEFEAAVTDLLAEAAKEAAAAGVQAIVTAIAA